MFDLIFATNYAQAYKDSMRRKKAYRKFMSTTPVSPIQAYVNEALEQFGDLPITEDIDCEIVQPKQLENGS